MFDPIAGGFASLEFDNLGPQNIKYDGADGQCLAFDLRVKLKSRDELGELPPGVYAGLFALFNLVLAASAEFASALLTRLPGRWTGIALRALASWLTAIAIMSLAFVLGQAA